MFGKGCGDGRVESCSRHSEQQTAHGSGLTTVGWWEKKNEAGFPSSPPGSLSGGYRCAFCRLQLVQGAGADAEACGGHAMDRPICNGHAGSLEPEVGSQLTGPSKQFVPWRHVGPDQLKQANRQKKTCDMFFLECRP